MKIGVIGGGAIGSIVAAYLAKAGEDVTLVARQEHTDAINQNGLKIIKADGEEVIKLRAVRKLDFFPDLVIFATKTQDLEEAFQQNADFLTKNPLVLTTQNGVQADNILSIHFDTERMISSIVMFGSTYVKPGEITYNFPGDWIIGKPFFPNDPLVTEVEGHLNKAFNIVVTPEIVGMKWLKLFVNFNNCIPALIGKSMQETFADLDFCKLSIMLLKEGVGVVDKARIKLVSLPQFPVERIEGLTNMPMEQAAGIINKTLTTLSKEPLYGSILQSIMRKKFSEIDFINGEVTHLGKNIGMQTPLNRKVVDLVHKVESNGSFFEPNEVKQEFSLN